MIPAGERAPSAARGAMKLALKLLVALSVGVICVFLVARSMDTAAAWQVIRGTDASAVVVYLFTLAATHFFRAWRWEFLLRPLGVSLPLRQLLPISSVGFMAILALPVRLGEFVRPYFVVRLGKSRMSAALGTVAVERIIDGLLISILFFGAYVASDGSAYPPSLAAAAWASLLGFVALTIFLVCALVWSEPTIRLALRLTLVERLSPRLAHKVADKLRSLIRGFEALGDARNLCVFLLQSLAYWGINGFGMWLLARGMNLPISLTAAYAAMAFTGVVISLPNAPVLVGQFHAGIMFALLAYLPASTVSSTGAAYAIVLHALNFVWYVGAGLVGLLFVPGGTRSFKEVVLASNRAAEEVGEEDAGPGNDAGASGGAPGGASARAEAPHPHEVKRPAPLGRAMELDGGTGG